MQYLTYNLFFYFSAKNVIKIFSNDGKRQKKEKINIDTGQVKKITITIVYQSFNQFEGELFKFSCYLLLFILCLGNDLYPDVVEQFHI